MDVSGRRAQRPERGKLTQMILGARIKGLRDNDRADDKAKHGSAQKRPARTRAEQPVVEVLRPELFLGKNVDLAQARLKLPLHLGGVRAGSEFHEIEVGLPLRHGCQRVRPGSGR